MGPLSFVVHLRFDIAVEDFTLCFNATDKWVPTGNEIQFRIDTNLCQVTQRTGVSSVPITIKVQSPDGGLFEAAINKAGVTTAKLFFLTPPISGVIWMQADAIRTYLAHIRCGLSAMLIP